MRNTVLFFLAILLALVPAKKASASDRFIDFNSGDLLLCSQNSSFTIYISENDNIGVKLALKNLSNDFMSVCNAKVTVCNTEQDARIIIGTVGQSEAIDRLIRQGKINAKELRGKREKYIITIIDNHLVIAGSERRGTIYGIYELSRQMGVSPWYYWMDAPISKHNDIYARQGVYSDGEPAVRYRGIFLNDEAPCLTSWVKSTFGTGYGDHNFYAKVFELVLRLKGNYIWPAMWGWAFYADDPLNSKTADDMGIMIGTSHHEPMCRSQKEWHGHSDNPNEDSQDLKSREKDNHKWDYATNKETLDRFWLGGVERNRNTEDIITIGMRGDGDTAMSEERNQKLRESVVENQRRVISKARGKKASEVPQLWALYKEVMDYYDDGMRVPDDVTMLLCDDNWGDIRRVPTLKERKRKGGWGLYYHVDYVGAPRNTKTINVTPIQNMAEQLSLAYNNGIDRLWILNVGDLKPMEYPIQLFMDMAWEGCTGDRGITQAANGMQTWNVLDHTRMFCSSLFGDSEGEEAARILNLCCKYNGRCTPEMLDANTYSLSPSGRVDGASEWTMIIQQYKQLEIKALEQYARLPQNMRDAYYQLILFPIQFMSNLHDMYYSQAMNITLHQRNDANMNIWADRCEQCFKRDAELCRYYNKVLAGGKWDGMMTQKHIGYKDWNDDFKADIMPTVYRTDSILNIYSSDGRGYITMEAEHFFSSTAPDEGNARWTAIADMGRTLSGMTLIPVTSNVKGACLTYKFNTNSSNGNIPPTAKVHVITKSTLDYLNKGGLTYSVSLDGSKPAVVNFNNDMNEDPKNIYSIYYPTIARRVIEKVIELPLTTNTDMHSIVFSPNDPGIILEKIVVDFGSYRKQYLFGNESPRR